jgi:hypothetical protein
MKEYFYLEGKDQRGPFVLEEIKAKGLTNETLVWFDGIENWTPLINIPELNIVLKKSPPKTPSDTEVEINKTELPGNQNKSEINLIYSSEKKLTGLLWKKFINLLGYCYFYSLIFSSIIYLFSGNEFLWQEGAIVFPIVVTFPLIIKKFFVSRPIKIILDFNNNNIEIHYYYFLKRKYLANFSNTQVKFRMEDKNIETIEFLDRHANPICCINAVEGLFSKEVFENLYTNLNRIEFFKKK